LKRPDEKFVTEKGYENPMFVEDVVRKVAEQLNCNENLPGIAWKRKIMRAFTIIALMPTWKRNNIADGIV